MATRVAASFTSTVRRRSKFGDLRQWSLTASNSMKLPTSCLTNFQGPVPTGFWAKPSQPTFLM